MKVAVLSLLCRQDEEFFDLHQESLREAYGNDASFFVTGDSEKVPETETDYVHRYTKKGSRGNLAADVLYAMIDILDKSGADVVIKADADTYHLASEWLNPIRDNKMVGFQIGVSPACSFGASYALSAECLRAFIDVLPDELWAPRVGLAGEDEIASMTTRRLFPNSIHLHPFGSVLGGWTGKKEGYHIYDVVHCGQGQKDRTKGIRESMLFLKGTRQYA